MQKSIFDYMDLKYKNRSDKDNIFPVGVTDEEFRRFCIEYLLGSDWYVVDPLSQKQVNEYALSDILHKYSKKFRKEERKHKRKRK